MSYDTSAGGTTVVFERGTDTFGSAILKGACSGVPRASYRSRRALLTPAHPLPAGAALPEGVQAKWSRCGGPGGARARFALRFALRFAQSACAIRSRSSAGCRGSGLRITHTS